MWLKKSKAAATATVACKRILTASGKAFSSQAAKPAEPVLARVRVVKIGGGLGRRGPYHRAIGPRFMLFFRSSFIPPRRCTAV